MSGRPPDEVALERAIVGALRSAIHDHGPLGLEEIGSAAKRVLGNLRNVAAPGPLGLAAAVAAAFQLPRYVLEPLSAEDLDRIERLLPEPDPADGEGTFAVTLGWAGDHSSDGESFDTDDVRALVNEVRVLRALEARRGAAVEEVCLELERDAEAMARGALQARPEAEQLQLSRAAAVLRTAVQNVRARFREAGAR